MQAAPHAALDAEPPHGHQPVPRRPRVPARHNPPLGVDVRLGRLRHVKVLRATHAEANVALVVSRLVVLAALRGPVLREVLCGAHDELELVERGGHILRVHGAVEVAADGGEVDEGLVVEVGEDEALELVGEALKGGGGHAVVDAAAVEGLQRWEGRRPRDGGKGSRGGEGDGLGGRVVGRGIDGREFYVRAGWRTREDDHGGEMEEVRRGGGEMVKDKKRRIEEEDRRGEMVTSQYQ